MRAPKPFAAAMAAVLLVMVSVAGRAFAATILTYHGFGSHSGMSISLDAFEAQLDYLEKTGHKVISMEELARCLDARQNPPDGAVVIAIDDGWASVMRAFPILVRRKLPFTLFLPMAYVANAQSSATLSQADIDALRAYPKITFANHSYSHSRRLSGNAQEAFVREDIQKSVERFRKIFGCDTKFFAYPYGGTSETYNRLLRQAGFEYLFVTGYNPISGQTPKTAIPRIAAHRLSLTLLASVLKEHEAILAKAKTRPAPDAVGALLTETRSDNRVLHLVE